MYTGSYSMECSVGNFSSLYIVQYVCSSLTILLSLSDISCFGKPIVLTTQGGLVGIPFYVLNRLCRSPFLCHCSLFLDRVSLTRHCARSRRPRDGVGGIFQQDVRLNVNLCEYSIFYSLTP